MRDNWKKMFTEWLLTEMKKRDWLQADLARASGLTTASISKYVAGRIPEEDALKKIARAFELKPEIVFRAAGLLSSINKADEQIEQIAFEASELNNQEKDELLAYIRMKKNLRNKGK
jgi:transcriptional regulator with XRE-family HTH domain